MDISSGIPSYTRDTGFEAKLHPYYTTTTPLVMGCHCEDPPAGGDEAILSQIATPR